MMKLTVTRRDGSTRTFDGGEPSFWTYGNSHGFTVCLDLSAELRDSLVDDIMYRLYLANGKFIVMSEAVGESKESMEERIRNEAVALLDSILEGRASEDELKMLLVPGLEWVSENGCKGSLKWVRKSPNGLQPQLPPQVVFRIAGGDG